nr:terminase small subunit [uncultured Mediterranean phage uvMED]BAR29491.1 terminase small subunit [uncultured Mediterranean phage uvMED]
MSKLDENMQDVFNLPDEEVEVVQSTVVPEEKKVREEDVTKDYEYTRGQLYNLIEKGQEALNGILDVAASSDHPRAYEVAALMIKNLGDTTDKLMKLQKDTKEVKEGKDAKGPSTVNNTMFVGSTADLAKMLKRAEQEGNEEQIDK